MQIVGYHHSISPIEKVLPKLLEKVLAAKHRVVVMAESADQLNTIDQFLWTYSKSELLPHGTEEDGNPHLQPIWLTTNEENPNNADVLVVVGSKQPRHINQFEKALILHSSWTDDTTNWAQSCGEFTLWSEQSQGGWTKAL